MRFTYDSYYSLLLLIKESGYEFANFDDWEGKKQCVVLRHDIDYDISKAVEMAEIEKNEDVKSTYFLLVSSGLYNIHSKESRKKIRHIIDCGHSIGLHFDEGAYTTEEYREGILNKILCEASILENTIGQSINIVSMHRPSREILEKNLKIPGMINAYDNTFFKKFKYISDSRRNWRESVEEVITSGKYERLQILTHAFWYMEEEKNLHDTIKDFIGSANIQRYGIYKDNFTNLESVVKVEEIADEGQC